MSRVHAWLKPKGRKWINAYLELCDNSIKTSVDETGRRLIGITYVILYLIICKPKITSGKNDTYNFQFHIFDIKARGVPYLRLIIRVTYHWLEVSRASRAFNMHCVLTTDTPPKHTNTLHFQYIVINHALCDPWPLPPLCESSKSTDNQPLIFSWTVHASLNCEYEECVCDKKAKNKLETITKNANSWCIKDLHIGSVFPKADK